MYNISPELDFVVILGLCKLFVLQITFSPGLDIVVMLLLEHGNGRGNGGKS